MLVSRAKPFERTTTAYRQCTRCVMDTTDPEITFDAEGRCTHCTEFLEKRARYGYRGRESDEELDRLVSDMKRAGRGRAYDCVIGVSGGADSSYLAYLAKQKGLRGLAVHLDNGWDSEKAVSNIKNVIEKLGFDYESYVLDWEEFKDLQLAFLRASIPEAETPTDVAIPAALHHFAAKYGVKYILSGGNLATEGILPKSWHYDARDLKYFDYIHRNYGTCRLRRFPTFSYRKEMYYKLIKGIRTVYPLDHVSYAKHRASALLSAEFGWRDYGGKHHESRYTKFIQSFYLYEKFGIDYRRLGFSMQISSGKITRADAIERLRCKPYDPQEIEEDKPYIAKKLGISKAELEAIISTPPKWYWEFPNDKAKLDFIYDTYRRIYGKKKVSISSPATSDCDPANGLEPAFDTGPKSSVSVVIPTYNYGRFISEAIQSALTQTHKPAEVIVIDDGSTDETEAAVKAFGSDVRYIKQPNLGVCAARNRGVAESVGEFIAFLDADDIWEPTKIEKQLAKFASDPRIGLVHCGMREFDAVSGQTTGFQMEGSEGWVAEELILFEKLIINVSGSVIVVKRDVFEAIGGFDERLRNGEDFEFCFRAARRNKVGFVPEALVNYRNHGMNATKNVAEMERSTKIAWDKVFSSNDQAIRRLRRRSYGNLHKILAGSYLQNREMVGFARNIVKSLWYRPSLFTYYLRSATLGKEK